MFIALLIKPLAFFAVMVVLVTARSFAERLPPSVLRTVLLFRISRTDW